MAEKGSPCVSRLGVATETTGVVKEWVAWETPNRCVFCWGSEWRGCYKGLRCALMSPPKKNPLPKRVLGLSKRSGCSSLQHEAHRLEVFRRLGRFGGVWVGIGALLCSGLGGRSLNGFHKAPILPAPF